MSFFGNLFGGEAETEAANKNRQLYNQYQQNGQGYLNNGLNQSLGALGSGYGAANSQLGQNSGVWNNYGQTANAALSSGLNNSLSALNSAKGQYGTLDSLASKYGDGTSLLLDSLGAHGAAGNANAVNSFQAGPGYQFQLDQGNDAINRRRASMGMVNSGNADIDSLKFGQGLANQEYGNWQNKLSQFINPELQATSTAAQGRAGIDGNIAQLYNQNAGAQVGVAGNVAQGQAGVNTGIAGNLAALGQQQAGLYGENANNLTNLAGNVVSGNAAANNAEAAGKAAGAKNGLGAAMGLASLAAGGLGGGFGGLGGAVGSAIPGSIGPTSYGGAGGPMPLTGGSLFGRMFS